jgi:hypothetical protein
MKSIPDYAISPRDEQALRYTGPFEVYERDTVAVIYSYGSRHSLAHFQYGHGGRLRKTALANARFVCNLLNHTSPLEGSK